MKNPFTFYLAALALFGSMSVTSLAEPLDRQVGSHGISPRILSNMANYDPTKKVVHLMGNVTIISGPVTITAPYAELSTKDGLGDLWGGVRLSTPTAVLTSQRSTVWYRQNRALLRGAVRIQKKDTSQPVDRDRVEYRWTVESSRSEQDCPPQLSRHPIF